MPSAVTNASDDRPIGPPDAVSNASAVDASTPVDPDAPTPISGEPESSPFAGLLGRLVSGPDGLANLLMLLGLLVICALLMRRTIANRRRLAATTGMSGAERLRSLQHQAVKGRDPVDAVMADAEELVRHLAGILDNKAARLEALIEQADAATARLNTHLNNAAATTTATSTKPAATSPTPPKASSRPPIQSATSVARSRPISSGPELTLRVYELADAGHHAADIAREVDRPLGQIELMLALRRASA